MVEKFMVEEFTVEKIMVEESGVEKFGVEMAFNLIERWHFNPGLFNPELEPQTF